MKKKIDKLRIKIKKKLGRKTLNLNIMAKLKARVARTITLSSNFSSSRILIMNKKVMNQNCWTKVRLLDC